MSRFFNITTSDDGTSTIFLYGDIGDYTEVQSGRIAQELMEAERVSRRIHVRINSNGGEVYSGIAIFNALRHSQADIRIYVDGIAASMASVIALLRQARRNEQICPSDAAQCERRVLRQQAGPAALHGRDRKPGRQLEEIYAERLGMSKEEVKQTYFDGEDHWLTAKEALDLGFIDDIYDETRAGRQYTGADIYFIQ